MAGAEVKDLPPVKRTNSDVKCLRCGVWNVPDNHICGNCGASLPLVYDEEGNVRNFVLADKGFQNAKSSNPVARSYKIGWMIRLAVLFGALFIAFILRHWSSR